MRPETSSGNADEGASAKLQTPPGVARIAPPGGSPASIPRDLYVDVACAKALIDRFGEVSDAFRIIPVDLGAHLDGHGLGKPVAIVMPPVLFSGILASEMIERLRNGRPHVGMYVVAREASAVARSLPRLAAAGVDEVFCLDSASDMHAFLQTMHARLSAPAPETEMRLIWKWFRESPERSLVMHCVRNGFRLDVWKIRSQVFSACRKTLQNRVALVGLPSPGLLARIGRVLHVQELERRGMTPSLLIARTLGFPSPGAMLRARRRLRKALLARGRQALVFASLLK
ncbi:MAG TPA: hypothetical protein VFZ73_14415 [Gemmatimonadaceae bacterium]